MNNNEHNQKQITTSRPIVAVAALVSSVAVVAGGLQRLQPALCTFVDGSQLGFAFDFILNFTLDLVAAAKTRPVLALSATPI
jgi:hypothetical protein